MLRHSLIRFVLAATIGATVFEAATANAANNQSFVASNGTGSICSRAKPCADFLTAYGATNAGGEIVCVDSGNFFGLTITHSITINCIATNGSVNQSSITINTAATDVVVIKGVDFDEGGLTVNGNPPSGVIIFNGAGVLHLEKITVNSVRGNQINGIYFQPTGPAKLIVADSSITSMGDAGLVAGIYIKPASGVAADVSIERSRIDANFFGIVADGTAGGIIRGVVSSSFVVNNVQNGITVSTSGSSTVLSVDSTKVSGNNYGLVASGSNAGMLVRRSMVNTNATGLFTSAGGVLLSYNDNSLNGNTTTDGAFTGVVNTQ